jgi:hypothetical protein
VSFAAITLCAASRRLFIFVVYFVIDSVRKLLDTSSYSNSSISHANDNSSFRNSTHCSKGSYITAYLHLSLNGVTSLKDPTTEPKRQRFNSNELHK